MIETLENVLDYLGVGGQYFIVNASNNSLVLKYDTGATTSVIVTDGTYTGTTLATALKTAIDTALTCTSTVTWNSTMSKFTLAVVAGHTLTYTHAGSTLGLLVGFNTDHSASVTLLSDIAAGDPTSIISILHSGVEAWIKKQCRSNIEQASYKEWYDGEDEECLFLKQLPIISIERLLVGRVDVIALRNSNTHTSAVASANSTGLVLTLDGTSNSTVTFAACPTLSAIVTAINTLGNGWSATLQGSDYGDCKSTEILTVYGKNCIRSQEAYLSIPDWYSYVPIEVYAKEGYLRIIGGWNKGANNIYVEYTAGYTSTELASSAHSNLRLAVKELVQWAYKVQKEENIGVTTYSVGSDVSVTLEKGIEAGALPGTIMSKLWPYKKVLI